MTATETFAALLGEPWCVLDTETTGLGPYDEIVEIGIVDQDGRTMIDARVRPSRPITARATRVHGLDLDVLAEEPPWPAVWSTVEPEIRHRTVLAWNAAFDLRLLRQSCARYRLPFTTPRFCCLREAFREQHPLTPASLDTACLVLGVPQRPLHRALADAQVARLAALALRDTEPSRLRQAPRPEIFDN